MVDGRGNRGETSMGQVNVKNRSGLRGITMGTRMIEDDRGVEHALHRQRENTELDEHARYALDLAEKTVAAQGPSVARVAIGAYLTMLIVLIGLMLARLLWVPYVFAGVVISTALGTMVVILLVYRRRWSRGAPKFADTMLGHGLCPICAYRVDGLPPLDDDAIVCAECGAAWMYARVGERTAPSIWQDTDKIWLERLFGKVVFWGERRIRDADGTPRTLLDAHFPKSLLLAGSEDHRERLIDARRVLRRSAWLRRFGAAVIAAVFIVMMAWSQTSNLPTLNANMSPGQLLRVLFWLYILCFFAVMAFRFFNPKGHSANKPVAIDEMLRRRVCPSCGGDMMGVTTDDRLRATCPRCRAVWRMPLILETLRVRARQTPAGVDEPGDIGD